MREVLFTMFKYIELEKIFTTHPFNERIIRPRAGHNSTNWVLRWIYECVPAVRKPFAIDKNL